MKEKLTLKKKKEKKENSLKSSKLIKCLIFFRFWLDIHKIIIYQNINLQLYIYIFLNV